MNIEEELKKDLEKLQEDIKYLMTDINFKNEENRKLKDRNDSLTRKLLKKSKS